MSLIFFMNKYKFENHYKYKPNYHNKVFSQITRCRFKAGHFTKCSFKNIQIEKSDFIGVNLKKNSFRNTRISNCLFLHCDFSESNFEDTEFENVYFCACKFKDCKNKKIPKKMIYNKLPDLQISDELREKIIATDIQFSSEEHSLLTVSRKKINKWVVSFLYKKAEEERFIDLLNLIQRRNQFKSFYDYNKALEKIIKSR